MDHLTEWQRQEFMSRKRKALLAFIPVFLILPLGSVIVVIRPKFIPDLQMLGLWICIAFFLSGIWTALSYKRLLKCPACGNRLPSLNEESCPSCQIWFRSRTEFRSIRSADRSNIKPWKPEPELRGPPPRKLQKKGFSTLWVIVFVISSLVFGFWVYSGSSPFHLQIEAFVYVSMGPFLLIINFLVSQKVRRIMIRGKVVPATVYRIVRKTGFNRAYLTYESDGCVFKVECPMDPKSLLTAGEVVSILVDPSNPQFAIIYGEAPYRVVCV